MRAGSFYTLILLSFFCCRLKAQTDSASIDYSVQKTYTIGGIDVSGADFTDKNVVKLLSGLVIGDEIKIPGDRITDAIKALWKQGLFEDIQIYQDKLIGDRIFLRIHVIEVPRLSKFKFTGKVRKNEEDELRGKIRLVREKPITDYTLGYVKNAVKDYFKNKGFFNAQVNITQETDRNEKKPHTILYINVQKGKKVRIKNLTFHGNTVVKSWKLRRKMEDSKPFRLYNPFNSGKYLEDNLSKDLPAVLAKYNSKGYRDARIIKDTVYFVSKKRVNIDVYVDEGHKFYFGKFKWFGNTKYRSGYLDTLLNIKGGDIFDQTRLEQKLYMNPSGLDITSLYMDDGYLFFNINPQETNVHNDTIDFDIHLYEGYDQ
jgi:outer membrane protein insertion porin family